MGPVISVSPFKCKMWALHDRLDEHITEETCKAEIQSFLEHGQLVPALGRPLSKDPRYDIELIYGSRRLFVARAINQPLLVEVRELSDREAIVAMDAENRHRKDISPYERGLCYARWLREKHFESQEDIARALNISASQVSRLLKLARMPAVIVNAFESAVDICEGWGLEIADVLEQPERRARMIAAARTIAASSPRPPSREVFRRLLHASVPGHRPRRTSHDQVVKGRNGAPLFRIRHQRNSVALVLPIKHLSLQILQVIQSSLTDILQSEQQAFAIAPKRSVAPVCVNVADKVIDQEVAHACVSNE